MRRRKFATLLSGATANAGAASEKRMKVALISAAIGLLTIESGHTQIDRADAELVMRDLMPTNSRCERISWESISYCRYETANTPYVVFEISFGPDGPQSSLTYDVGNSEGRQFLRTIRLFFSRLGVEEKTLSECIQQSKSKASEFLTGNWRINCRYVNIADDRVGYEIFADRASNSNLSAGSSSFSFTRGRRPM
jgi:hypothetical protein